MKWNRFVGISTASMLLPLSAVANEQPSLQKRTSPPALIATGVLAVKTAQGFYTYAPAPELDTPAKVLAKSKSFGLKLNEKGVPVRIYKHAAVDEPYVKPGYIPMTGSPLSRSQTHLLSRTEFAWSAGLGSRSVSVAVLDDRLPEFHPSLSASYDKANAYDVRHGNAYQWMTPDDVDPSKGTPLNHGVAVAGVVASDYSQNLSTSSVDAAHGVAPGTSIMPVMVCCYVDGAGNETRGAADDVAISNGILYAARLTNSTGKLPSRKADAIVLSYDIFAGQSSFSAPVADAVQRAVEAGVLFVTGSGNGGRLSGVEATDNSISAIPGVIVVAGADLPAGTAGEFSTRGTAVDVAASFTALTTSVTYRDGAMVYTTASVSGTSYSAPYVAGLYALAKATYPALTPGTFGAWISADQITLPNEYLDGYDPAIDSRVNRSGARDSDFGFGIIDAKRTINAALAAAGKPTVVSLPAVQPKLSIQNATNANSFQVFATVDNPYPAGSYLGNLSISFDWNGSSSSTYPSLVGHTSIDQVSGAELCPDSVGARETKEQTATTLSRFGFSILPTPASCAYGAVFLVNSYHGDFTVRVKSESFFAPAGTDTKTFVVGVPPAAAVSITSFTASPTTITSGGSSNVSWAVSNATACTINGVSVPTSGSQTAQPTSTTTLTLSCTGAGAPASRALTITVNPPSSSSGGTSGGTSGGSSSGMSTDPGSGGGGSLSIWMLAVFGFFVVLGFMASDADGATATGDDFMSADDSSDDPFQEAEQLELAEQIEHMEEPDFLASNSFDETVFNPATGLLMAGGMGGLDLDGNPFGVDLHSDDHFGSGSMGFDDSWTSGGMSDTEW